MGRGMPLNMASLLNPTQLAEWREDQLRLNIFSGHPFFRRFRFLADPRAPLIVGLLSVSLFLVCALADGNLLQTHLHEVLCRDVRSYLGATYNCPRFRLSTEMSASRDLPSLILLFALPMTVPLALRQWENITRFLSAMSGRGMLVVKDEQLVYGEVSSCNQYFTKWSAWNPLVAFVALIAVLLVVRAQTAGRIYPSLQTSRFEMGFDPHNWWLSLSGVGWTGMFYFALACIVVYVIFIQTIHGSRVVLLLWRIRSAVDCGVQIENTDRYYGWSEVRAILLTTWSLIIIHGICLAVVGLSLPADETIAIVLAPLLFQWLIFSPPYLFVPYWLTRRNVSGWKRVERARLREAISKEKSDADRRTLEQKLADLRRIKVYPYTGVIQQFLYYISTFTSLIFVIETIRLLYG